MNQRDSLHSGQEIVFMLASKYVMCLPMSRLQIFKNILGGILLLQKN